MKIIDSCFDIVKNRAQRKRQKEAAAQPGQQALFQPSPQTNLSGENAGLSDEVSDFIQELEAKQKEQKKQQKQREKFEAERAAMMQPGQQTLQPQSDQDIQQVADENQQLHENQWGFKRGSMIEQMEMLGMIQKAPVFADDDDDDKKKNRKFSVGPSGFRTDAPKKNTHIDPVKFDSENPNHPAKKTTTAYDIEGKPIKSNRRFDDFDGQCDHCGERTKMYMSDGSRGCATEDCIANTADFMQGGNHPQQEFDGEQVHVKVGETTPTQTTTKRVDKPPGGLGGLFPMEPDPNWEPHIKINAPRPQAIEQRLDSQGNPTWVGVTHEDLRTGEPMDIAMRLLKHAETPEAKKHKKEYDTKYESTPERRKYRTELTQERRKRGVAGKGGKDMSHTTSGSIVPEDMHANRARHFKERGTLKKTVLVKSYRL